MKLRSILAAVAATTLLAGCGPTMRHASGAPGGWDVPTDRPVTTADGTRPNNHDPTS